MVRPTAGEAPGGRAAHRGAATGEGQAPAEVWVYEGRVHPYIGLNAVAGKKPEEFGLEPTRYDEMIPGCYDPKARLRDMDLDGVWGALSFPSFPGFAGTVFLDGQDRELARLCVQAWNDFVLDEWCATAPGRLIPLVILPLWDVEACVAEIHRTAAKGAKAISFPENPAPRGLPSFHTDHWDPVFSAAEETGLPLCLHFGTSGKPPKTAEDAPFAVTIALFGCNAMFATADLLFSPVLHKHPKLKIGLSEGDRLDPVPAGAQRRHLGAASLLPERQPERAALGAVPQALPRLLHRRPLRRRGTPPRRHRQDHLGVRLPALRLLLAQEPRLRGGGPRRRTGRRGAPDRGVEHPPPLQPPRMSRRPQSERSDWTDLDLLTREEAHGRLLTEIAETDVLLAELGAGAGDIGTDSDRDERELLRSRLRALREAADDLTDHAKRG